MLTLISLPEQRTTTPSCRGVALVWGTCLHSCCARTHASTNHRPRGNDGPQHTTQHTTHASMSACTQLWVRHSHGSGHTHLQKVNRQTDRRPRLPVGRRSSTGNTDLTHHTSPPFSTAHIRDHAHHHHSRNRQHPPTQPTNHWEPPGQRQQGQTLNRGHVDVQKPQSEKLLLHAHMHDACCPTNRCPTSANAPKNEHTHAVTAR